MVISMDITEWDSIVFFECLLAFTYKAPFLVDLPQNKKVLYDRVIYFGYPQSVVENTAFTSVSIVKQPDFQPLIAVILYFLKCFK